MRYEIKESQMNEVSSSVACSVK